MKKVFGVVGLGYGDEGKGLVVNSLLSSLPNSLVVRYSGGQQAGHTVMLNDITHVFSNFGSGSLRGVPTYWSKHCSFDPVGACNELHILKDKGIDPILYLDAKCPITTPLDKLHNQSQSSNHGTCGVGVGATFEREENRYSLLVGDLEFESIFKIKYGLIKEYYKKKNIHNYMLREQEEEFFECCNKIKNTHTFQVRKSIPLYFENFIFEGSQGLLLDQDFGFFPHVTRSSVGSKNILEECKSIQWPWCPSFTPSPKLFLVTRAFQTRHGNGPMTNENIPHNIKNNPYETNVANRYQGEFRKSLLDLDLLQYALQKEEYIQEVIDFNKELVITCMDLVENEWRYTIRGQIVSYTNAQDFSRSIADHLGLKKVTTISSPFGGHFQ